VNSREVNLSEIKSNPNNPRIIKDDKFHKLVESIIKKTFMEWYVTCGKRREI